MPGCICATNSLPMRVLSRTTSAIVRTNACTGRQRRPRALPLIYVRTARRICRRAPSPALACASPKGPIVLGRGLQTGNAERSQLAYLPDAGSRSDPSAPSRAGRRRYDALCRASRSALAQIRIRDRTEEIRRPGPPRATHSCRHLYDGVTRRRYASKIRCAPPVHPPYASIRLCLHTP